MAETVAKKHGHRFKDLTGQRFGKLTALCENGTKNRLIVWKCVCDCGSEVNFTSAYLRKGFATHCGCVRRRQESHGMEKSREYTIWDGMIQRCHNPKNKDFLNYGGRGIVVCDRWRTSFSNFFEDMGTCPEGLSIDREDNNGPYCPENCRWADRITQNSNSRSNVKISAFGLVMTMMEWSRSCGVPFSTIRGRIRNGWHPEDAITIHPKKHGWGYIPYGLLHYPMNKPAPQVLCGTP